MMAEEGPPDKVHLKLIGSPSGSTEPWLLNVVLPVPAVGEMINVDGLAEALATGG